MHKCVYVISMAIGSGLGMQHGIVLNGLGQSCNFSWYIVWRSLGHLNKTYDSGSPRLHQAHPVETNWLSEKKAIAMNNMSNMNK